MLYTSQEIINILSKRVEVLEEVALKTNNYLIELYKEVAIMKGHSPESVEEATTIEEVPVKGAPVLKVVT